MTSNSSVINKVNVLGPNIYRTQPRIDNSYIVCVQTALSPTYRLSSEKYHHLAKLKESIPDLLSLAISVSKQIYVYIAESNTVVKYNPIGVGIIVLYLNQPDDYVYWLILELNDNQEYLSVFSPYSSLIQRLDKLLK